MGILWKEKQEKAWVVGDGVDHWGEFTFPV
jgi:hypothetical protein